MPRNKINHSFDVEHKNILKGLLGSLNPYAKYRDKPVEFCRDVLGVELWEKQAEAFEKLLKYKRLLVKSANGIGKTMLAATIAEWFHLCYSTGECIITAPRAEQLADCTFKEIRILHGKRPGIFPRSCRIETSPDHYIKGTTASSGDAFQGIHAQNILIIFEECTGVDAQFWEAAKGILAGGNPDSCFFLGIFNPTDTSAHVFNEQASGNWETMSISAFDHPNIRNELQGLPPVIPSAVRLHALKKNMGEWGEWISGDIALPSDVEFREKGQPVKYWRPGPIGESRILGRYPSQSATSIFSEADFQTARKYREESEGFMAKLLEGGKDHTNPRGGQPDRHGKDLVPKFGCDVARFGDDDTVVTGRIGPWVFLHEKYNGMDTEWVANRIKLLCNDWGAKLGITATKIPVMIDDTGVGGGVTDQRGDYNFQPINAATLANEDHKYPNRRSEMLFNLAEMMREGSVRFCKSVDQRLMYEIQRQAMGITYKADSRGGRVAEGKDKIKERLGKSPDHLDSLGLAFYGPNSWTEHKSIDVIQKPVVREASRPMPGSVGKDRRHGADRQGFVRM